MTRTPRFRLAAVLLVSLTVQAATRPDHWQPAVQAIAETPLSGTGDLIVFTKCFLEAGHYRSEIDRWVRLGGKTYPAAATSSFPCESRTSVPVAGAVVGGTFILSSPGAAITAAATPDYSWSLGPKRVLFLRLDFPDYPGEPKDSFGNVLSAADLKAAADQDVAPFFQQSSYGKTTLQNTVSQRLYRMRHNFTDYVLTGDVVKLWTDADAAAGADYDVESFDRIIYLFTSAGWIAGSKFAFVGGTVSNKRILLNGVIASQTIAHELGHTYGLPHASLWQVNDGDPISADGHTDEYADPWDVMGTQSLTFADFNPWFKARMGWVTDADVHNVTSDGTYQIYASDTSTVHGRVALRITKDPSRDYWVSYRSRYAGATPEAHVMWGYHEYHNSELLDLNTPGSNATDAALRPGQTFIDPKAGITLKLAATEGSGATTALDISVSFAPIAVMIRRSPEDQVVAPGQNTAFTVVADGIPGPQAYQWQHKANGGLVWEDATDDATHSGTTTARLEIKDATLAMNGEQWRCVATAGATRVVSEPATLTVATSGIVTRAGRHDLLGYAEGAGAGAQFGRIGGLTVDRTGSVYVCDGVNRVVRKVDPHGNVSVFAGSVGQSGNADGTGPQARFGWPSGIAIDGYGNFYVSDLVNHNIRRITPAGAVTTLAGGTVAGSDDGVGAAARFMSPVALTVGAGGDVYVADTGNRLIRRVRLDGRVTTLAGTAQTTGYADGDGANAKFGYPSAIAAAPHGDLLVTDREPNNCLRLVTPAGHVTTLAGSPGTVGQVDGRGGNAWFTNLDAVVADGNGNWYVGDDCAVRKITAQGEVTLIAGTYAAEPGSNDGPAFDARFRHINGLGIGQDGSIFIADEGTVRQLFSTAEPPLFAPLITTAPHSQAAAIGSSVTLSAGVDGRGVSYQWSKDGVTIPGATAATLAIGAATTSDTGRYSVTVANSAGTAMSPAAAVAVLPTNAWVVNLSARSRVDVGDKALIGGFVISGAEPLPVLIRAVGPTLARYEIAGPLIDPALELRSVDGTLVATNDTWPRESNGIGLRETFDRLGAFPLYPNSNDAAVLMELPPGVYTTVVRGVNCPPGVALIEVYDASRDISTSRLSNVSARAEVYPGEGGLIAGFVVRGSDPKRMLIRGVGPTLAAFQMNGTLPDPRLEVIKEGKTVAENDDWGSSVDAADIRAAAAACGTFPLRDGSKDAALLLTLAPGNYSAQVESSRDTVGIALVEVYEVPAAK